MSDVSEAPNPLTSADRALLDALREETDPTEADRRRVRDAVLAVAAGSAAATVAGAKAAALAPAPLVTKVGSGLLSGALGLPIKIGLAVTLLTASGSAAWWLSQSASSETVAGAPTGIPTAAAVADTTNDTAVAVAAAEDTAAEDTAVAEDAVTDDAAAPTTRGPDPPEPSSAGVSAPSTPSTSAPPSTAAALATGDLEAEVALMRHVQEALGHGDHTTALARLNEHARRFPRGALSAERNAAHAITLCRMGKGRAAARRMLESNPTSPLAARLREACGLE